MRKRSAFLMGQVRITECLMIFVVSFLMILIVVLELNREQIFEEEEKLPRMNISLNQTTLKEIHEKGKDIKYPGNEVQLYNNKDSVTWHNVEIKGRGNFTWGDVKKPYRLKFQDGVEMLGLPKSRKKILLTNNLDDTLMRNDLGLYISRLVGEGNASIGEYVWLNIDGEDLGLYYVVNPVEISKKSVDLKNTNGVLVELNNTTCELENEWYKAKSGDCLTVKDAVSANNLEDSMKLFMADFDRLETAAEKGDYETVEEVADVKSLAEYFLISELSVNPDAYVTSFYFYKDGEEDKIHAGLAWDFDCAFGNLNLGVDLMGEDFYDPWDDGSRRGYALGWEFFNSDTGKYEIIGIDDSISKLMYHLLEIPEFQELIKDIFNKTLAGKNKMVLNYLDKKANYIRDDALRDMELWNKNDFDEAVDYLKWWVEQRFCYLESKLDGVSRKYDVQEF